MFNKLPGLIKAITVKYKKNETILILKSSKRYFSNPKKSILLKHSDGIPEIIFRNS